MKAKSEIPGVVGGIETEKPSVGGVWKSSIGKRREGRALRKTFGGLSLDNCLLGYRWPG